MTLTVTQLQYITKLTDILVIVRRRLSKILHRSLTLIWKRISRRCNWILRKRVQWWVIGQIVNTISQGGHHGSYQMNLRKNKLQIYIGMIDFIDKTETKFPWRNNSGYPRINENQRVRMLTKTLSNSQWQSLEKTVEITQKSTVDLRVAETADSPEDDWMKKSVRKQIMRKA